MLAMVSHLDTVFPRDTPLAVRREATRIYGPGLADNAHALAALLACCARSTVPASPTAMIC